MSHSIEIIWDLGDQELSPGKYLTDHKVILNENLTIDGGSSPDYGGSVSNINPEQKLAAAVSSCFMMTFLALAAKMKWPVIGYRDKAIATLGKNSKGQMSVVKLELNPKVEFSNKFIVDAKGHPFWIMTEPFKNKISADGSTSTIYSTGVTNNGSDYGTVTFTIPTTAPDKLYYQCGNHDNQYGLIQIRTIDSSTQINVANEIIGVKNYSLRTLDLSNGMKIKFTNSKVSSDYQNNEYCLLYTSPSPRDS